MVENVCVVWERSLAQHCGTFSTAILRNPRLQANSLYVATEEGEHVKVEMIGLFDRVLRSTRGTWNLEEKISTSREKKTARRKGKNTDTTEEHDHDADDPAPQKPSNHISSIMI